MTYNPLLQKIGLPQFDEIRPEHVVPAMTQILSESYRLIEQLTRQSATQQPITWESFIQPLENMERRLHKAWSTVSHLNAVMNTENLRLAYNEILPKLTLFHTEILQNSLLYDRVQQLKNSESFKTLEPAQKQAIKQKLRDFHLNGVALPVNEKQLFKETQERLSKLETQFEENILDSVKCFAYIVQDNAELEGVPDDIIQTLEKQEGYIRINLRDPTYFAFMQNANNRNLREHLYRAHATRASEFGNVALDNTPLMTEILQLRQRLATILGFQNYAEISIRTKMAEHPQQVLQFLLDLAQSARPFAEKEIAELKDFASSLGILDLQAWDMPYVSEKLCEKCYAFSEQEVKQYFPEPMVLRGLFQLIENLYGIIIRPAHTTTWHKDVRFFEVFTEEGVSVGNFYLDLYARENKRSGAWMDECLSKDTQGRVPTAFLTCNFSPPPLGKLSYLTHDEILTLFHEFGHGLHHLLSRITVYDVSGIKGVEWDAVELPSQFMENFAWNYSVLSNMSAHAETKEPLPRDLFDKMLASKNFQAGLKMLRQIEFALFDMRIHLNESKGIYEILQEVRAAISVVFPPSWNRFPNSFAHIFAGGYSAGYYSYKWAEVLSADIFELFAENGVISRQIGQKFWDEILAQGGSRPAITSFLAFRGREPDTKALLRQSGLANF